jgi:hypothetical protein
MSTAEKTHKVGMLGGIAGIGIYHHCVGYHFYPLTMEAFRVIGRAGDGKIRKTNANRLKDSPNQPSRFALEGASPRRVAVKGAH